MRERIMNVMKKKEDNKGFTLVELIVVIVILAILAAILIPGLLKWIDKAKEEQYILEARNVYLAAEATVAQKYAAAGSVADTDVKNDVSNIEKLADVTGLTISSVTLDGKYNITAMTIEFTSATTDTVTATLENKTWKATKKTS